MISDLLAHGHLSPLLWACHERKGSEHGPGLNDCVVRPISKVPPAPSSATSQRQPLTQGIPFRGIRERNTGVGVGEGGSIFQSQTILQYCPQSKVLHGRPGLPASSQLSTPGLVLYSAAVPGTVPSSLCACPCSSSLYCLWPPLYQCFAASFSSPPRKPLFVTMCLPVSVIPCRPV